MKIQLAQYKPVLGNVEKNVLRIEEICKKAADEGFDLIVFPELAMSGYLMEDLGLMCAIKNLPESLLEISKKISVIVGGVEMGKDKYVYNSAFYLENGELLHTHRKVYLPTYGMFDEARYFRAGNSIKAFDTKFGRIGMLICEDMWHQTSPFILAQDGAEHIFVITNSPGRGMGEKLAIENEWNSLIHGAAISNTVYVTMVNRVGVEDGVTFWGGSRTYSPNGELVALGKKFQEETLEVIVDSTAIERVRFSGGVGKNENLHLVVQELKRIMKG